jgi:hypothetical protein
LQFLEDRPDRQLAGIRIIVGEQDAHAGSDWA